MPTLRIERRLSLPAETTASTFYIVKAEEDNLAKVYFTDSNNSEVRRLLSKEDVVDLILNAGLMTADKLNTARIISLDGDATGSASFDGSQNITISTNLTNTGVNTGTYTKVTVDTKGRVVAASNLSATDIPVLDASKITTGIVDNSRLNLASTTAAGIVQLNNSPNSASLSTAPTSNALKTVYDMLANAVTISKLGTANGVATLDANGLVPASQLPSYVDDVLEVPSTGGLPLLGESGKIYVTLDDNKIYRWSGSGYIEISPSAGNSDTATRLATARTISLNGDATGSTSFDGSQDITITVSVADNSHNHSFVNIADKPTTLSGYGITDAVRKYTTIIGSESAVEYIVEHGLNTTALTVSVFTASSPHILVYPDVEILTANSVGIKFTNPPITNEFICTIIG